VIGGGAAAPPRDYAEARISAGQPSMGGSERSSARFSHLYRLAFFLEFEAKPSVHRPHGGDFLAANDIASQLTPECQFAVRDGNGTGEPRGLRLPKLPEPIPEEGAVIRHLRFRAFDLKALVALAPGLAIRVSDAVIARDDRYGFAEPFAKLFVKFARSSEAVATWS